MKVKLLDFQMMRMSPSGLFDLGYFIFISTDREFREQHLEACLREYHGVLVSYLDFELTFRELQDLFERGRPVYLFGAMVMCEIREN